MAYREEMRIAFIVRYFVLSYMAFKEDYNDYYGYLLCSISKKEGIYSIKTVDIDVFRSLHKTYIKHKQLIIELKKIKP